jgi:Sigma-70, region 4
MAHNWSVCSDLPKQLNEVRARRIREGGGFVAAEDALTSDGAHEIEINITASAVIRSIGQLPEAQRETVLLVYGEGYSYSEAAAALTVPIETVMSRLAAARATLAKLDSSQSHPARAAFGRPVPGQPPACRDEMEEAHVKTSGRQGRDGDDEQGVGPARSSRRPRSA